MDISAYQHMNIRMSTRGKRPLRNLTPTDKVRAIQRIHNGETKASVSRDIGVPESTLRGWCKNEQKLRFMCRQLGAGDQLGPLPGMENPPEKRPRFDNHIQTPKFQTAPSFDEFGYGRLPLNGLSFPSNGTNAILEKIAFNEIMKKHVLSAENSTKQPVDNMSNQMATGMMGSSISLGGDYSQLSMMQNLNLLSLLSPNMATMPNLSVNTNGSMDGIKNEIPLRLVDDTRDTTKSSNMNGINNTASLSVKNWAKDPAEHVSMNLSVSSNNATTTTATTTITTSSSTHSNTNNNGNKRPTNDSNNNNVKDNKNIPFVVDSSSEVLSFPPPLPLGLLQIPNINNISDLENGNSGLLEWCKVFNASLNFLALVAAAAALQPNKPSATNNDHKKEDNILYKELTKTAAASFDLPTNLGTFMKSEVSNDSYFDSEPEDLSVRSTATSKLSSPANSRSQSPMKSSGSYSPLPSDGEH